MNINISRVMNINIFRVIIINIFRVMNINIFRVMNTLHLFLLQLELPENFGSFKALKSLDLYANR